MEDDFTEFLDSCIDEYRQNQEFDASEADALRVLVDTKIYKRYIGFLFSVIGSKQASLAGMRVIESQALLNDMVLAQGSITGIYNSIEILHTICTEDPNERSEKDED